MGRTRKFQLGDIAKHKQPSEWRQRRYVIVEYKVTGRGLDKDRRYRVIPLNGQKRRRGDAMWLPSWQLEPTGEHSGLASVKTYRANQSMPDRGCDCQCCIHDAYDPYEWTNHGRWRD